ncbi:hypothetical protein ACDX78_09640 [Virgibacillus oceani]
MKKIIIYILVFLFLFSVYKDLNGGSLQNNLNEQEITPVTDYKAVYLKVQHGDTILSIVESINEGNMNKMDIDQIMEDFKLLNPNVQPEEVKVAHFYYFPSYE